MHSIKCIFDVKSDRTCVQKRNVNINDRLIYSELRNPSSMVDFSKNKQAERVQFVYMDPKKPFSFSRMRRS